MDTRVTHVTEHHLIVGMALDDSTDVAFRFIRSLIGFCRQIDAVEVVKEQVVDAFEGLDFKSLHDPTEGRLVEVDTIGSRTTILKNEDF